MNAVLKEVLLKKCRKKVKSTQSYEEEEQWEEFEEEIYDYEEAESIEELPLEDILAEKRRKYSAREEFIYLLYNDLLPLFIKEWDGKVLRKKPRKAYYRNDYFEYASEEDDDIVEIQNYERVNELKNNDTNSKEYEEGSQSSSNMFWKVSAPDEFANIKFINNNTYSGRISRKMMEGKGVYRWSNGTQYKGDFEQNRMHGNGLLEWNNNCWYEGDFVNGYRHGRGIVVDGDHRYMYTGKWSMDQRHGKGYSRYGDNGSYDGDWVMDKMDGIGLRTYGNGSCYYGQWKNGLRHGKGTMVWTNGNVYRGQWKCGTMHGYGEYVWNGFFNKTFTWPQEASYVGHWRDGLRHGEGELKLDAVGGAKYSGYWNENKKHGYGVIIGSNGEKLESDPLFLNDILCSSNRKSNDLITESESEDEITCVRVMKEVEPKFVEKPSQLKMALITPVLRPEQFPPLSYYITRLLDPKSLEDRPSILILYERCYTCRNKSCTCLTLTSTGTDSREKIQIKNEETTISDPVITNSVETAWKYEERWTYNCLTMHIARLRQIYNNYARLFTTSAPKCNLVMSRLSLWQLWRDCGIHEKGLNLIEIDNYIAQNKTALVKNPHHPFEKIEIWQFLHALLEISWHLYTKFDNIEVEEINGKIAGGLHKFLENDIYPHAGDHVGNLCQGYQDLLPMTAVFELCKQIGYPFSAKDFLRTVCVLNDKFKGTTDPQPCATTAKTIQYLLDGINCVTISEKVNYISKLDDIFAQPYCTVEVSNSENNSSHGLSVFKELGALKLLEIMVLICPAIKDAETNLIVNMDYEFTFLEFYEIILEATNRLLIAKKISQMKLIETENDNSQKEESSEKVRRSTFKKSSKTKNKI